MRQEAQPIRMLGWEMSQIEENKETKESTGRTIPNEFWVDFSFENIEDHNFFDQWHLLQEEKELEIERGSILMTLNGCICKSIEEENKLSRCLIAYKDVDLRCC